MLSYIKWFTEIQINLISSLFHVLSGQDKEGQLGSPDMVYHSKSKLYFIPFFIYFQIFN